MVNDETVGYSSKPTAPIKPKSKNSFQKSATISGACLYGPFEGPSYHTPNSAGDR